MTKTRKTWKQRKNNFATLAQLVDLPARVAQLVERCIRNA